MWKVWSTPLHRQLITAEATAVRLFNTQKDGPIDKTKKRISEIGLNASNNDGDKGLGRWSTLGGHVYKNASINDCSTCSSTVLAEGEILVRRGIRGDSSSLEVTLNRPGSLNAISMKMIDALSVILREVEDATSSVGLLIFRGAGDKAFCAGGDVVSLATKGSQYSEEFFKKEYNLDYRISQCRKPCIVSFWKGAVMGGGVGLTVHNGYRIVTDTTRFAMPEVTIGLFPDVGMTRRLLEIPQRGLGMYLGLTGASLGASDLLKCGLATHFLPLSKFDDVAEELAKGMPAGGGCCREFADKVIGDATGTEKPDEGQSILTRDFLRFVAESFSQPISIESLFESLERSSVSCRYSAEAVEAMRRACPLSLAITFRAMKLQSHVLQNLKDPEASAFAEALRLELGLARYMTSVAPYNFREGVRALLIDKDRCPKWVPRSLSDIDPATVNEAFLHAERGDIRPRL